MSPDSTPHPHRVSPSVTELRKADIRLIADYWTHANQNFLASMGVDVEKLPSHDEFTAMLSAQIQLPIQERRSFCVIWHADGKAIGHCNTNPTHFGVEATMHLHIWQPESRRQGLGLQLLRLTLPVFFRQLELQRLYCEPYAKNPAPNKTLERVGFELEREYVTVPGAINFEQPVKPWVMTRERASALGIL